MDQKLMFAIVVNVQRILNAGRTGEPKRFYPLVAKDTLVQAFNSVNTSAQAATLAKRAKDLLAHTSMTDSAIMDLAASEAKDIQALYSAHTAIRRALRKMVEGDDQQGLPL